MSNKIVRYEFDPTNPPPLTEAQKDELARLAKMKDEDIDFSDIPPLSEEFWKNAVRGKFYRPVKRQVTLRLDADILHWFKARQAGKRGYQTAINAALRKVIEDERGEGGVNWVLCPRNWRTRNCRNWRRAGRYRCRGELVAQNGLLSYS